MMTTPEPLSGFVITMSSRFFSWLTDLRSAFGGFGVFLSMYFNAIERRVAAARSFLSSERLGSSVQ